MNDENQNDLDIPPESFISERLELSMVGDVEVSTVKLPKLEPQDSDVWETCVFYADGTSHVTAQYFNELDARTGHRKIVDELLEKVL